MPDRSHLEEKGRLPLPDLLPVLPLKDAVVYPYIIVPLSVVRDRSLLAVDQALAADRLLMLVTQKEPTTENPTQDDLYQVGTAATIMRMLKLPDGRIRILVQGLTRARLDYLSQTNPFLQARIDTLSDEQELRSGLETEALTRSMRENLERVVHLGKQVSSEVMVIAANLDDPGRLADLAASNLELEVSEAQRILEELRPIRRLRRVNEALLREIQLLTMQQEITSQARSEMDKNQREYFLRQQLKAIQDELGEGDELAEELAAYRSLADKKGLSEEALGELERQAKRLERSHPDSAEAAISRTYLDWLTGLPWRTYSEDLLDLAYARRVLDEDHYDLERIKQRILEFLAVRKLKRDARGPILCFVGPPGVGKTSLGRSIARAMGRRFVRISLGGVRDEAEIRGHRRTYVGALSGRILQGINQAGTGNPVFMLDEIDKIGADFRGDPSSALLEVLDPEQNFSFRDHYLGVAYDLSRVMFIATGNLLDPIHPAFLDRMEVVRLSGYTCEEKRTIARRHLIPRMLSEHGLTPRHVAFTEAGLSRLIEGYTKESGLRNLERELAAVCRKVAMQAAEGRAHRVVVTPNRLEQFLGPAEHFSEELLARDQIGIATGLAWTAAGGDLMFVEVVAVPGRGELLLTGKLGEIMKESAHAALTYARAYAARSGLARDFFSANDLHVHVPAGAIPKDGPSAGITVATAIISVMTRRPVRRRVAMTGELTLRGDILPIAGLKEKVLAAGAAGIQTVVLPKLNERDLAELPERIKKNISFHCEEHMESVVELALAEPSEVSSQ